MTIRAAAGLGAITLCCLVAAGCAVTPRPLAEESFPAAAPAVSAPVERPPAAPTAEAATALAAPASVLQVAAAEPPLVVVTVPVAPIPGGAAKLAVAPVAAAVSAAVSAPVATIAAPVAAPGTAASLDFRTLGTRLRQTKTIGLLTKLVVKIEADHLVNEFRAYHLRRGTATLAELRRSYDTLFLKVLSLVQNGDPPLAHEIAGSRAAIWDILVDPRKFTESNLMAGVAR